MKNSIAVTRAAHAGFFYTHQTYVEEDSRKVRNMNVLGTRRRERGVTNLNMLMRETLNKFTWTYKSGTLFSFESCHDLSCISFFVVSDEVFLATRLISCYFSSVELSLHLYLYIHVSYPLSFATLQGSRRRSAAFKVPTESLHLSHNLNTMSKRDHYDLRATYTCFRILVIGRANAGKATLLQQSATQPMIRVSTQWGFIN